MTPAEIQLPEAPAAGQGALRRGDALLVARSGAFRLLVPLASVERVLPAALPSVRPAVDGPAHPVVSVEGTLLPVLFAEALLGAIEVRLRPGDQLLQLREGARRALLWVSAVEEVVACAPLAPPRGARMELVRGFAEADGPLAVLDVASALALAEPLGDQECP